MKRTQLNLGALALLFLFAPSAPAAADPPAADTASPATASADWPQFRGPGRDGLAAGAGILSSWPSEGPAELWRKPLGAGFSAPVVAGDRVVVAFLEARRETAEGEEAVEPDEVIAALDRGTGRELWRRPLGAYFQEAFGDGPRSTPLIDGGLVFALSSRGDLRAFRLDDGEPIWSRSLIDDFGARQPGRGFCNTPVIDGDLLVFQTSGADGKAFAAVDKATGATRWTTGSGKRGHSSPILAEVAGHRQLIFVSSTGGLTALSPAGEVLWQAEWPPGAIAMPVFVPPDRVFVSGAAELGGELFRIVPQDPPAAGRDESVGEDDGASAPLRAETLWHIPTMRNHFNASVLVGDHLYGFDNGTLRAISVATGETAWVKRGLGKGSLIAAGDRLIVLGDRGDLVLAEATSEEYRETGRLEALAGRTWTSPSLAGSQLFLRDADEIVAYDLSRPAAASSQATAEAGR